MKHIIASFLLLIMFIVSGYTKLYSLDKTITNFQNKLNFNETLSKVIIYFAIIIEILAPLIILYYIITTSYKTYAYYSVWALIIFTILATIIYHPPNFSNYYKSIGFWANMSVLGGLLLLEHYHFSSR